MAIRLSFVVALLLSAAAVSAELKFDSGDDSKTVLLSFGEATSDVNVLCKDASGVSVSGNSLFSTGTVASAAAAGGYTNYTIPMTFAAGVGSESYTVECGSDSITGTVTVAGFVIKDGSTIVSGENGAGVSVGQSGSTSYDVMAAGPDGSSIDISGCSITARESSGPYMKEVDSEKTTISSSKFTLAIAENRVGTGSFVIDFDCPAITYMGENFETILKVTQETSPAPACVVMTDSLTESSGSVSVKMFNANSPPRDEAVSSITMTVDGETVAFDEGKSDLSIPDHTIVFSSVPASGKATIKCDGADAIMQGGDLEVTAPASAPELAKELITTIPEDADLTRVTVVARIVEEDPDTMTKAAGEKVRDAICAACEAEACGITAIVKGSAVVTVEANVKDANATKSNIEKGFAEPDCPIVKEAGYEKCSDMTKEKAEFKVVTANLAAVGTGLATWTIVLIAGLGALALIAVIMLGLLAVYRRSAEVSESDYSSSGPLGVPDPSDLLYEQSIVRDIYGRGDFPDGGPTPAVAEQRAREADLREETPRPPSSSGLSRQSAATDDASSTYSV